MDENEKDESSSTTKTFLDRQKIQSFEDRFRELRMLYIEAIQVSIARDEIDALTGLQLFCKATRLPQNLALDFLCAMGDNRVWSRLRPFLKGRNV